MRHKRKRGEKEPGNERIFLEGSLDLCKLRDQEGKLQ
jgi:hypothetical protein